MAHSAWQDDSLIIKVCSLRRHHTGTQKEKHTAVDLCKNIDLHRPHTHTHSETFGSACTLFFFLFCTQTNACTHCTPACAEAHSSCSFLASSTTTAPFPSLPPSLFQSVRPIGEISHRVKYNVANICL